MRKEGTLDSRGMGLAGRVLTHPSAAAFALAVTARGPSAFDLKQAACQAWPAGLESDGIITSTPTGEIAAVSGIFNYQSSSVPRSLLANGKVGTKRDLSGTDSTFFGVDRLGGPAGHGGECVPGAAFLEEGGL